MKENDEWGARITYAGRGKLFGNADGTDTDFDGVNDAMEGSTWLGVFATGGRQGLVELGFVYGTPTDDGKTICFRGGGMNPCTIDTDLDGLPDGWEMQHAGVPVQLPGKTVILPRGAKSESVSIDIDEATYLADGLSGENAVSPTAVYIAGGMDATWKGDAVFDDFESELEPTECLSYDDLLKTKRDVDFDHDGLQNYQEYLTQSVRHFRYDDITTPLMGRILTGSDGNHGQSFGLAAAGGSGTGYPVFDPADAETFAANAAEAWYGRDFVYYETVTTGVKQVIKVISPGVSETNYIYYTAEKKQY
jgi:hypothetical protein